MCGIVVGPLDPCDSSWFIVSLGKLCGIPSEFASTLIFIGALVSATLRSWLNGPKEKGAMGLGCEHCRQQRAWVGFSQVIAWTENWLQCCFLTIHSNLMT